MQTMARMEKKREKRVRRYNDGLRSARGLKYQPRHDQDVIDTDVTCTRDFDRYIYFPRDGREKKTKQNKSRYIFFHYFLRRQKIKGSAVVAHSKHNKFPNQLLWLYPLSTSQSSWRNKSSRHNCCSCCRTENKTQYRNNRGKEMNVFFLLLPPVFLLYTILSTLLLVTILPILRSSATVILILCEETG